jgi:nucleotide-binding universal stress UspA family protein
MMSEGGREPAIRRILVALDVSPHSMTALEAAADLAAGLKAELVGIFVEDINLLRLAQLPFAREVGIFSTSRRQLTTLEVERQLQAQARRARRALAIVAGRAQVPWSFRVARGVISSELLAAASEADLVILGKIGWSLTRARRLGSTARAVLSQATCLTLILQEGRHLGLPVLIVYDGSVVAHKALAAAARLVRGRNGFLTVIVLAEGIETAQALQSEAAQWLRGHDLHASYRWLVGADLRRLAHMVEGERCGMLVLPSKSSRLQNEMFLGLLDEVDCPVLMVR